MSWNNCKSAVISTLILLVPVVAHADHTEQLRKGEVFITLKEIPGTKLNRGTIEGVIEAPIPDIWNVVTDYEHYKDFMPRGKESRVLEKRENGTRYFSLLNMPWPISDVSFDCDVTFARDHQSLTFKMVPGTGKGVKQFDGGWELAPFEGSTQSTLIHYNILFEPETNYPRWVMNMGTKATLGKIVDSVRKRLKDTARLSTH